MTPEELYYQVNPVDPLNPESSRNKPIKISGLIKYVILAGLFFLLGYVYHLLTFGRGYIT